MPSQIVQDCRPDRLVLIRIPTEADERVRDLVRCRETFQREIVKSRHDILKFMPPWLHLPRRHALDPAAPEPDSPAARARTLAEEDGVVLAQYLALLDYKLQRIDELDRRIQARALTPRYKPLVDRIGCFRGL
jgi:hypothetical protein